MADPRDVPVSKRPSSNAFEKDKPGTNARTEAEGQIEALRQRGGLFVNAVRATRMPMALTDPNLPGNPIVFANEAFVKLTGYSMDEVLGQQPHFMNGRETDPKDAARFDEATSLRDAILPGAQDAFEQVRRGYAQGLFRNVDVLDSQRRLFELRLREIEALRAYRAAATELERITGTPLSAPGGTRP